MVSTMSTNWRGGQRDNRFIQTLVVFADDRWVNDCENSWVNDSENPHTTKVGKTLINQSLNSMQPTIEHLPKTWLNAGKLQELEQRQKDQKTKPSPRSRQNKQ